MERIHTFCRQIAGLALVTGALGILTAGSAPAAVWDDLTLGRLTAESSHIVRGHVVALDSQWNAEGTLIETRVEIAVAESFKGGAGEEIILWVPGGRVDDLALDLIGGPSLAWAEEVLIFASRDGQGRLHLPRLARGKYRIDRDAAGTVRIGGGESNLDRLLAGKAGALDSRGSLRWSRFADELRSVIGDPEGAGPEPEARDLEIYAEPLIQPPQISVPGFHVIGGFNNSGPFQVTDLCPNELGAFVHWDLREFAGCGLPYEVNGTIDGAGQPTPADAAAAVALAAASWSSVAPSLVTLVDVTNPLDLCPRTPGMDGRNCVAWDPGFSFVGLDAVTYLWRSASSGVLIESDIAMDGNILWQGQNPSCVNTPPGIESFALHEFGHLLGLHHPDQWSSAGCGNDDATGVTRMNSVIANACNTTLHQADVDGVNYLYTPDLGDAEDGPYPTRVRTTIPSRTLSGVTLFQPDDGPEHLFGIFADPDEAAAPRYQYEHLALCCGAIDDSPLECEARVPDRDAFDDGVVILAECKDDNTLEPEVQVLVGVLTAADLRGRRHNYGATPMYLNAWFDWNDDGDFADGNEHVIGAAASSFSMVRAGVYGFRLTAPPNTPCEVHSRFRLDWGADVGQVGGFDGTLNLELGPTQHGEVEDYVGTWDHYGGGGWDPWWTGYCHNIGSTTGTFPSFGVSVDVKEPCHPVKPNYGHGRGAVPTVFPVAGSECMDSTLSLQLDIDQDGTTDEEIGLAGPVCVQRGKPKLNAAGRKVIDTEMLSLEMTGLSHFAGELTVRLAPGQRTLGKIRQTAAAKAAGVDASYDHPAYSFFDVYFVLESENFGTSTVLGPMRAEADLATVPPGESNGQTPSVVGVPTTPTQTLPLPVRAPGSAP